MLGASVHIFLDSLQKEQGVVRTGQAPPTTPCPAPSSLWSASLLGCRRVGGALGAFVRMSLKENRNYDSFNSDLIEQT